MSEQSSFNRVLWSLVSCYTERIKFPTTATDILNNCAEIILMTNFLLLFHSMIYIAKHGYSKNSIIFILTFSKDVVF
jgi:hypothetical protein